MSVLLTHGNENLDEAVGQALDTFLAGSDLARGVFIKPNIVFPVRPASGEITSPALVRCLVAALRERHSGVDIVLGEGVAAGCDAQENFRVSGFAALADELGVPLVDLDGAERVTVEWQFGRLALPRAALERIYISLPILKPSSACVISGALKMQKGLLLPGVKKQFHRMGLHEPIAALNAAVRPDLSILDGSNFFGPGALIAGDNCGEIDATACRLLGIAEPEHVRLTRAAGVFADGFAVTGDAIHLQHATDRPAWKEYKQMGRLRLWSNPQACTGCRYIFHEIRRSLLRPDHLPGKARLLAHALQGAEIVMGKNPNWRREYRTVICVGACTRRVAEEGGYLFIPGCPPALEDFYNHLARDGRDGRAGTGKADE